MTKSIEFTVTGERRIHCGACEQRIERALRQLQGVQDVRASVDDQRVVATVDPSQVAPERLQEKLVELGYEVASPGGIG